MPMPKGSKLILLSIIVLLFCFQCTAFMPDGLKAQTKLRKIDTSWNHANPENVDGFILYCGKTRGRYDLQLDASMIECSTMDPNHFEYSIELKSAYKCFAVKGFNDGGESPLSNESCLKK